MRDEIKETVRDLETKQKAKAVIAKLERDIQRRKRQLMRLNCECRKVKRQESLIRLQEKEIKEMMLHMKHQIFKEKDFVEWNDMEK